MKYILLTVLFCVYSLLTISIAPPAFIKQMNFNNGLVKYSADSVLVKTDSLTTTDSISVPRGSSAWQGTPGVPVCAYDIQAELKPAKKLLTLSQRIVWRNTTQYPTQDFYFHMYPNAYKSNSTIFADGRNMPVECRTEILLDSFKVNGKPAAYTFVNTDITNSQDSTVAKTRLEKTVLPGDSVVVDVSCHYKVPRAYGRMGCGVSGNFYFFAQWFVKPGVFEAGRWVCSPFLPHAEFYSDFAEFNVSITTPDNFTVYGTGSNAAPVTRANGRQTTVLKASKVHDFAWTACSGYITSSPVINHPGGGKTAVTIVAPESYGRYMGRYETVLRNAFGYFGHYFGLYPYKDFTMVIVPPKAGRIASMEYPQLVTIAHPIFTSDQSLEVEKLIIHEFSHQYFYGIVANNEAYEAWLDEGMADYLTSRMLDDYGLSDISRFRLFGYLQVQGLELLAMGEIPLIYTLTKIRTPNQADALYMYYQHINEAALSDSSYLLNSADLYEAASYGKGEIFLKTLERMLGKDSFFAALKEYYAQNQYRHVKAKNLFDCFRRRTKRNLDWYFRNYYENSYVCDYSVNSVAYDKDKRECRVEIKKNDQGYFPYELALYTVNDTLIKTAAAEKRRFTVIFQGVDEPLGAELDPKRVNYFDKEFANNSQLSSGNYEAPVYYSTRWFFWMQSFLLIFGSIV